MQVIVFDKEAVGLPGTSPVADLGGVADDVSFTHGALWGPVTASIMYHDKEEQGIDAARDWLGNPVEIRDDSGVWLWEGYIYGVHGPWGSRSLEGYANRVYVHYDQIDTASPPVVTVADQMEMLDYTPGQDTYGVIEYHRHDEQLTAAEAGQLAGRMRRNRRNLLWTNEGGTLGGSRSTSMQVTLDCRGWWNTLNYQGFTRTQAGTAAISTLISYVLNNFAPFIDASRDFIATTVDTHRRERTDYAPCAEVIKDLVDKTDEYIFYLGEGRIPYLQPDNRGGTTPDYYERADGVIEDAAGAVVHPAMVRPDRVLRLLDYVPVSADLTTGAIASIESRYLAETTYRASSNTVSYKTAVMGPDGEIRPY